MNAAIIVIGVSSFLLILESILRINVPDVSRPSTIITLCAAFVSEWAQYIGYQIGRFTDVWYIIKEFFGKDLYALFMAMYKLLESPWYLVKGYFIYYTESATPKAFIIVILALSIALLLYYYANDIQMAIWKTKDNHTEFYEIMFMIFLLIIIIGILGLFAAAQHTISGHKHHV